MNRNLQIASGIALTVALALCEELLPIGTIFLIVIGALALANLVFGLRLPLFIRVFTTGSIFYCGYVMCLVGRTMEPGFTFYTVRMALVVFFLYALWPALTLLRIWQGKVRVAMISSIIPLSLFAAATVAGIEEQIFIQKYSSVGVGVTKRWTVSNHWLSYDKEAQRLDGSD